MLARVEISKTTQHHHKGGVFRAEVNVDIIQNTVLRAESVMEDLYLAINDARNKIQKQIQTYKTKLEV